MKYEHALFTQGINVDWDDPAGVASHAEALRRLAQVWFPQLEANISMLDGPEWEVLSHDVLATPTGAVLTILARRPSTTF